MGSIMSQPSNSSDKTHICMKKYIMSSTSLDLLVPLYLFDTLELSDAKTFV